MFAKTAMRHGKLRGSLVNLHSRSSSESAGEANEIMLRLAVDQFLDSGFTATARTGP
jgi:hypothetical protein